MKQKRRVAELSRPRSPLVAHRNDAWRRRLQALKAEHPVWGYRRLWASVRFVAPWPVHTKRGWRLMRAQHLVVLPHRKLTAKRTPTRNQPKATKPDAWWGIAMTKALVDGIGWVALVVVRDWSTKKIVGDDAGTPCTARHGLAAVDMAVNRQCPHGARGQGISLMRDTGCQPTSLALMQACQTRGIHPAVTSDHNPQGHAETERLMRTRQEECLWLTAWRSPSELIRALAVGIDDDNGHYWPSSLGDKTPKPFEREYQQRHSTAFVAA